MFTLLLTPLYTRVLSPADYGVVDVALTLSSVLAVLITFGVDQALGAHFFDKANDKNDLVTTGVIYTLCIGILLAAAVAVFARPIAELLYKDPTRAITVQLLAVQLAAAPTYAVLSAALRLRMGIRRVNALGLAYLLTLIGCNIVFVLVLRMKATGIVAANAIATVTGCVVGLALTWQPLRGRMRSNLARRLLLTGGGLVPGALSVLALSSIDRLMLTQYVPQADLGLYSIANKLASMFNVATATVWAAWWPLALELAQKPDAPRQYARIFELFLSVAVPFAFALGAFAPEILSVFATARYIPAAPFALALLIYFGPVSLMSALFSIGLYAAKRTHLVSVVTIVGAVSNILLNLVLCPQFGVWGAVWATVIAGLLMMMLTYAFSRQVFFVDYRWVRIGLYIIIYIVAVMGLLATGLALSLPVRVVALAVLIALPFMLRFVSTQQVSEGLHMALMRMVALTRRELS
jgi:O-antigen/teichoic acid export membrane protein